MASVERLQALEKELGRFRVYVVCARLRGLGWADPREIPLFVWEQAYMDELRADPPQERD